MDIPQMKTGLRHIVFAAALLAASNASFAEPHYGADLSVPVISTEPDNLRGFQLMFNYDPDRYKWRQFNVYVDGGFSHFYLSDYPHHAAINIYSVAPVVRYTFKRHGPLLPYLELSIGFAYLNQTRIENRNLGIHFSFQDRMGIGTLLGMNEKLSLGVHVLHYSNSRLSSHNSGISIPLVFDIGYRFS
jgi:Lipid A 3-O-deacylase (PagL)